MDVPVITLTTPAAIVNQAVDRLGQPGKIIGAITDGTAVSETARRNYGQILRMLLRGAHWNFARRQSPLTLLGDVTGQSAAPVVAAVEQPWTYAYAWPTDAVQGRWMPIGNGTGATGVPAGNVTIPPVLFGSGQSAPLLPGRFLVGSSSLYPIEVGEVPWNQQPDLRFTEGLGPVNRKIILTDLPPPATFVYTRLVTVIEEWDASFRDAMVSLMAIVLAPVAIDDAKLRVTERDKAVAMAQATIRDARVANGNEAGWPQSTEHTPPWIAARSSGLYNSDALGVQPGLGGTLGLFLPWEPFSLGGSVF